MCPVWSRIIAKIHTPVRAHHFNPILTLPVTAIVLRPIDLGFWSGSQQADAFWINIRQRGTRGGKWGEKDRENRRKENRQKDRDQASMDRWRTGGWTLCQSCQCEPIRLGWGALFRKKHSLWLSQTKENKPRGTRGSRFTLTPHIRAANWHCFSIAWMFLKLWLWKIKNGRKMWWKLRKYVGYYRLKFKFQSLACALTCLPASWFSLSPSGLA